MKYAFTKVGMTNAFDSVGNAFGVTVLKMHTAKVLRHEFLSNSRTLVVVEYDTGHKKKLQRGWIVKDPAQYPVNSELPLPKYVSGQKIKLTGLSKGRGFQDVITRFGFGGGPASHGSRFHRAPGSVGMRTEPGRVLRGKKMPGHDGTDKITLKNVKVVSWSASDLLMAVCSGVPGARGSVVYV